MNQMSVFLHEIYRDKFSAFRKKSVCEHVLIKATDDWKRALDNGDIVGAVLMDLSKAFDCLPHKLLIAKPHAYGFSVEACTLMASYLTGRRQRVKLQGFKSKWFNLRKGVPQGSILGPILFNIFINDLLYGIDDHMYNYADYNTIAVVGKDLTDVKSRLS